MKANGKARACIVGLGVMVACAAALGQDVVIVANKDVSISQISNAQLRDIFTGVRSRFEDGKRVIPVLLKGGPAHEVFLHKHLRDNPIEFRARWQKAVFIGQGSMLKEFNSEAALLDYVGVTPGAIGYVSRVSEANAVKVLSVSP